MESRTSDVIALAADDERILISHDVNSLPGAFAAFLAIGNQSPGVILVSQDTPIGTVVESLVLIWIASTADEWAGKITWLPL